MLDTVRKHHIRFGRMRSPRAAWLILLVACIVALAHVCALPGHSHAASEKPHVHDEAAAPGESDHGDAIHSASCDAAPPAPTTAIVALIPVSLVQRPWPPTPAAVTGPRLACVTATSSPPLFLLHASLLI